MTDEPSLTLTLYVRSDAPVTRRREHVITRLDDLERAGRIAGFSVSEWPRQVSLGLPRADDGEGVIDTVRRFEAWADRHSIPIRPPFDVRRRHSRITGETDERVVLPVMCLAAFADDELVALYPCGEDESVLTLDDGLAAIDEGDVRRPEPPERDVSGRPVEEALEAASSPSPSTDAEAPEPNPGE